MDVKIHRQSLASDKQSLFSMSSLDGYATVGKPGHTTKLGGPLSYKFYDEYQEIQYTPTKPNRFSMCFVIVTCRSLLWTLLTVMSTLLIIASIITPQWLVGYPRQSGLPLSNPNSSHEHPDRTFRPTIGIFNRCTRVHKFGGIHAEHCATFVTGFSMPTEDFPDLWKSSLIFFLVAVAMLGFTNITAVFSLCVQAIFKKSIFTVSGLIQSIAGLFLIVGMVLYPSGWGSERVQNLCGENTGPFLIDRCSMGWAFFGCMGGTVLVFISAILSIHAETSTSSDRVEKEILDGKSLICIM